jgi:hypothetical protein
MKFNIRKRGEGESTYLESVKGELVSDCLVKCFIHKEDKYWVVSEFYTGCSLIPLESWHKTKQAAIDDVRVRARNEKYWPVVEDRIEYHNNMVKSFVEKYGYANQD